jgi:hypothetical protein
MTTRLVLEIQDPEIGGSNVDTRTARIWRSPGGRVFACSSVDGERARIIVAGVAPYDVAPHADVVVATPEPEAAPEFVAEIFARFVRPIVLQLRGAEVLHASAVRGSNGVTAFVGPSMSGKSTLAAALGAQGQEIFADDVVVWRALPQGIVASAMEFQPRLRPQVSALGLGPGPIVRDGEAPLAAICFVERTAPEGAVSLTPLDPATTSPAVMAQALAFWMADEERNRAMVANYLELVSRVPLFSLAVPWDLARLSETAASVARVVLGERG